jgi:hypothetical protein
VIKTSNRVATWGKALVVCMIIIRITTVRSVGFIRLEDLNIKIFAWQRIALYFCTRNDGKKTYKTHKETTDITGRLMTCFA